MQYPYQRKNISKAYIVYKSREEFHCFIGSLEGGKSAYYLKLIEACSKNVKTDMENGLMAIYHLPPLLKEKVIVTKMKHDGYYFDKLPKKAYALRCCLEIKRIIESFIWKYL